MSAKKSQAKGTQGNGTSKVSIKEKFLNFFKTNLMYKGCILLIIIGIFLPHFDNIPDKHDAYMGTTPKKIFSLKSDSVEIFEKESDDLIGKLETAEVFFRHTLRLIFVLGGIIGIFGVYVQKKRVKREKNEYEENEKYRNYEIAKLEIQLDIEEAKIEELRIKGKNNKNNNDKGGEKTHG